MKIRIKDDVFEVIKIERSEHMYYDSIVHITIPFSEKIEKFTEDWYWNKETKNIISEERTYWTCKDRKSVV